MNYEIRPLQPADIASISRIHIDGLRVAYQEFMPIKWMRNLSYEDDFDSFSEWLLDSDQPPNGFVIDQGDDVVGFILYGASDQSSPRFDAEIYKLFVHPDFQGCGLGRALMIKAANRMKDSGFHAVELWAYTKSSSVGFYKHLGGIEVRKLQQIVSGEALEVTVFGWELTDLLKT